MSERKAEDCPTATHSLVLEEGMPIAGLEHCQPLRLRDDELTTNSLPSIKSRPWGKLHLDSNLKTLEAGLLLAETQQPLVDEDWHQGAPFKFDPVRKPEEIGGEGSQEQWPLVRTERSSLPTARLVVGPGPQLGRVPAA